MKKLITIILIIFSIIYIYILTYDQKIYYLSFSNNYFKDDFSYKISNSLNNNNLLEKHIYEFSNNNYRIIDYLDMIEDNKYIIKNKKKVYIKNAMIKSDIISISLGSKDYNESYDKEDKKIITIRNDLEKLIKKIREYSKEDIYFISIYTDQNNNKYINKLNDDLKEICKINKINFININNIDRKISNINNIYISKYIINNK